MGEGLLKLYRSRVSRESKLAFFGGFVATVLFHLFKFVNYLPNHDSVYNYYASQNVVGSGRWALAAACAPSSFFDLPWVIGILSAACIGLTSAVVVKLFKIKNPVLTVLAAALLAAAPGTTETFFFIYTADGYMLAMLLAALGAYFLRLGEHRVSRYILGGACICVSCGIYQAYVSFALVLIALSFALELLRGNVSVKDAVLHIVKATVTVAASMLCYLIIWKLSLAIFSRTPTTYQGISEVGSFSMSRIISALVGSLSTVLLYFLQWNVLEHGFSLYSVLSLLFFAAFSTAFVIAVIKSRIYKRRTALLLAVLGVISVLPFSCIWLFFSDSVQYRPMMLQSLVILFVFVGVLFEEYAGNVTKNIACLLLCATALNNALMANIAYFYMDRCYERTYGEAVLMMSRINELADEYEFDRIAVIGSLSTDVSFDSDDPEHWHSSPSGQINILTSCLEKHLLFDNDHVVCFLKNTFALELEKLDEETLEKISETDHAEAMPCWPSPNSVSVEDGILIIKLSERKEA